MAFIRSAPDPFSWGGIRTRFFFSQKWNPDPGQPPAILELASMRYTPDQAIKTKAIHNKISEYYVFSVLHYGVHPSLKQKQIPLSWTVHSLHISVF